MRIFLLFSFTLFLPFLIEPSYGSTHEEAIRRTLEKIETAFFLSKSKDNADKSTIDKYFDKKEIKVDDYFYEPNISEKSAMETYFTDYEKPVKFDENVSWKSKFKEFFDLKENDSVALFLQLGYLTGNTTYDYNHHTSELEFPMNNWMIGAGLASQLENSDFSLSLSFWTDLESDAGDDMKDKDWNSAGTLISSTKSKAEMDAFIFDINGRYDFYKKASQDHSSKLGLLLGYRHENFYYDMFDIHYETDLINVPSLQGQTTNQGQKVLEYEIWYSLPYIGLVYDLEQQKWGVGVEAKWSFYPTSRDQDNHLLRNLTFYGDYDKNGSAWMANIYGFWKLAKQWELKLGVDLTFIQIDGRTWDATNNPAWNQDQSTEAKHFLGWARMVHEF